MLDYKFTHFNNFSVVNFKSTQNPPNNFFNQRKREKLFFFLQSPNAFSYTCFIFHNVPQKYFDNFDSDRTMFYLKWLDHFNRLRETTIWINFKSELNCQRRKQIVLSIFISHSAWIYPIVYGCWKHQQIFAFSVFTFCTLDRHIERFACNHSTSFSHLAA